MTKKQKFDFCTTCRKDTAYTLEKQNIVKIIKDREYTFSITTAICDECGGFMGVPGLIDQNIQEIDAQFRACEGIATVHAID